MILLSKKVPNSEEYSQSGEVVTINNPRGDLQLTEIDTDGKSEQATSILPDGYTQVDYIESSGTQYIDTGIKASNVSRILSKFQFIDVESIQGLLGGRYSANNSFQVIANSNNNLISVRVGSNSQSIPLDTNLHTIDLSLTEIIIDGVSKATYSSVTISDNDNVVLCARRNDTSGTTLKDFAKVKTYKTEVYTTNNAITRNLIPCYRNSDNVVGMYDIVNNVFYTNQGTGSFTYGKVVSIPNPDYPQEIETITGNVKLLTNKNHAEIYTSNWTLTSNNTIKNNARNDGANLFKTINVKKGQTVRLYFKLISKPTVSTTFTTYLNDADDSSKSFTNFYTYNLNQIYTKTFTVTKDARLYVRLWGNANSDIFEFQFWVTIDDTMTEYKPYKGITISLGNTELCKVGSVADKLSINTKTGVMTKTSKIKKIILDGSENYNKTGSYSGISQFNVSISGVKYSQYEKNVISNYFIGVMFDNSWTLDNRVTISGEPAIRFMTSKYSTVADFKTWLSNNPVTVYYRLATPVTEEIGTLSQEQLQAFKMVVGENTYQLSSDVGTSNMVITYEDYFDYFDFDKILLNGYEIDEQPNIIAKKQYANGRRKKIQTEYTDVVIKVNLGCFDGDTLSNYLNKLQDGEYQYYSLKDKQKKNANFIVTLPSQKVQSSANEIIVDDFEVILEKSSDV